MKRVSFMDLAGGRVDTELVCGVSQPPSSGSGLGNRAVSLVFGQK